MTTGCFSRSVSFCPSAREDVGGAARYERHEETYGPGGIVALGQCVAAQRAGQDE